MSAHEANDTDALREAGIQALRIRSSELSPFTEATYRRVLKAFCTWHVIQYGNEATVALFTEAVITRYVQWSAMRVCAATVRLRRSALRWIAAALAMEVRHAK